MTFPDLSEGCVLCLPCGRLWIGLVLQRLDPWHLPLGSHAVEVLLLGEGPRHPYYRLSGQRRRWTYLDLSSKAVFFNTKWFLSPSWDCLSNYHNSSLSLGCEDKALMSSEPSDHPSSRAQWPGGCGGRGTRYLAAHAAGRAARRKGAAFAVRGKEGEALRQPGTGSQRLY